MNMEVRMLFLIKSEILVIIAIFLITFGCLNREVVKKEKKTPQEAVKVPALLADGKPDMNNWDAPQPGHSNVYNRVYFIAPPVIPHSIAEMKIKRDQNDCLGCHEEAQEIEDGHIATGIPQSHRINPFTGEKVKEGVIGMRYNCIQCHVPRTK